LASTKYPALDLRFAPGPGAGSLQDFLYAELDAFEPVAIHEHETGDGWRVFFRAAAQRNAARAALLSEFRNALLDLSPVDVEDEDWARRSQSDLKAVRAGRIVVAPPWDVPPPFAHGAAAGKPAPDIVIVIEPSMGFGTGHHATTRLCLELLQEIDVRGRWVIDVGTGSGVLAIAAARLGASSVLALDHDPDALVSARENVARSGEPAIEVREGDVTSLEVAPAHVILANLTASVLRRTSVTLTRCVAPGGFAVISGFGQEELDAVCAAFERSASRTVQDGDWVAARLAF
jgi:ribosomal protein L11 methyltransferase